MIKIRLSFDSETEKEEAIKVLNEGFNVMSVSKNYNNRDNKTFRVYVDAELKEGFNGGI